MVKRRLLVTPEKSFSRVDEWISQVIVKVRKMEAGVQTISGSLTVKGRSERGESVSRYSKDKGKIKKNFFFPFDKREIEIKAKRQ